jgi:hypothetical protein
MKYLQAAVGADGSDGEIVLIVAFQNLLDVLFRNHDHNPSKFHTLNLQGWDEGR